MARTRSPKLADWSFRQGVTAVQGALAVKRPVLHSKTGKCLRVFSPKIVVTEHDLAWAKNTFANMVKAEANGDPRSIDFCQMCLIQPTGSTAGKVTNPDMVRLPVEPAKPTAPKKSTSRKAPAKRAAAAKTGTKRTSTAAISSLLP